MRQMIAIQVKSVDYAPDDLYGQTPFGVDLLRQIPGPDAPDYWLGQLRKPLQWQHGETLRQVTHIVVTARHVGHPISSRMQNTGVNISYVTDPSILQDAKLEFSKCSYVAIGVADAA